jgi:hypothetical protein
MSTHDAAWDFQPMLPGFVEYRRIPKQRKRSSKKSGTRGRHRSAAFYRAIVPLPTDNRGQLLEIGPYSVLKRTDGQYIVVRYEDRTNRAGRVEVEMVVGSDKRAAVVELVRLAS